MAGSINLEDLLCYLERSVEEKRQVIEKICKEKELLFKPWPKTSPEQKEEQVKNKENVVNEEDKFTPEEKDGLNLINDLLKKTHKAIIVQKKIKAEYESEQTDRDEKTDVKCENITCDSSGQDKHKEDLHKPDNFPLSGKPDVPENHLIEKSSSQKHTTASEKPSELLPKSKPLINKSSELLPKSKPLAKKPSEMLPKSKSFTNKPSELLPKSKPITKSASNVSSQKSNLKNTATNKSTPVPNNAVNKTSTANKRRPSSQDSGQRSRPSCRNSANQRQPVHMSAPFKTDPNVKVPKRPSSRISVVKVAKSRYMNSLLATSRNKLINNNDPKSETDAKTNSNHSANERKTDNDRKVNKTDSNSNKLISESQICLPNTSSVDKDHLPISGTSENLIAQTDTMNIVSDCCTNIACDSESTNSFKIDTLCDSVHQLDVNKDDVNSCQKDLNPEFLLKNEGSTLKIPVKLKKLVSQNRKLRQNVSKVAVTKKVGVNDKEKYLKNIESMFDTNSDLSLQYRKLQCLYTHNNLLQLLKSLQLETINELSSVREILEAKKTVEFILTAYHDYEIETKLLLTGAKHSKSDHKPVSCNQTFSTLFEWFPTHFYTDRYEANSHLTYQSKKDLERYLSAHFKFQLLQMQKTIMNLVKKELLPLLKQIDPHSSEYVSMYRAVYGLLTSHGHFMPGAVKETG